MRPVEFHYTVETKATPQQALAALTDFTDTRPEIWTQLDPDQYDVHEVGDGWAEVTEGSHRPAVWARERYAWTAETVEWRTLESNFCEPGSGYAVRIGPGAGRGSRLEVDYQRTPSSPRWFLLLASMRPFAPRMFSRQWAEILDRYAEQA